MLDTLLPIPDAEYPAFYPIGIKASCVWIEAHRREYQGFIDRDALEIVPRPKNVRVLDSITRNEYKMKDGVLDKRKTRWCVRGDQQDYEVSDSYAPVLKATEVRLLVAIGARHMPSFTGRILSRRSYTAK